LSVARRFWSIPLSDMCAWWIEIASSTQITADEQQPEHEPEHADRADRDPGALDDHAPGSASGREAAEGRPAAAAAGRRMPAGDGCRVGRHSDSAQEPLGVVSGGRSSAWCWSQGGAPCREPLVGAVLVVRGELLVVLVVCGELETVVGVCEELLGELVVLEPHGPTRAATRELVPLEPLLGELVPLEPLLELVGAEDVPVGDCCEPLEWRGEGWPSGWLCPAAALILGLEWAPRLTGALGLPARALRGAARFRSGPSSSPRPAAPGGCCSSPARSNG